MSEQQTHLPAGIIHEKLMLVMSEVEHIKKENHSRGLNFAFRGIEHVMNSLHVLFKKHGVVIVTEIINHEFSEIETKSGTKGYHHLSRVAFHMTASDGSRCTIVSLGEAMDYGDKGATKTLSIALKYALLNLFLIPTKETAAEDPDADSTHEVKYTPKPASKPAAKPDPRVTVAKRIEADKEAAWFEVVPFEADGHPVKGLTLGDIVAGGPWTDKKGNTVTAKDLINQVLDYIDPVALEHELAVKRLKDALTEIENPPKSATPAEPGKDEVPGF